MKLQQQVENDTRLSYERHPRQTRLKTPELDATVHELQGPPRSLVRSFEAHTETIFAGCLMGQLKMTRSFRSHNVLGWSAAVDLLVSSGSNDAVCDPPRSSPMKHTANTIKAIGNINIRMRLLTFDRKWKQS